MLLAKSCSTRNNIKNGTLKVGTLFEYRETEIQQIADKEEGYLWFNLKFDGDVKIPAVYFNTFNRVLRVGKTPGIEFPGACQAQFIVMDIVNQDDDSITLRNSHIRVERQALNSFIFCVSLVRKMADCINIFPNYDDYWYIRDHNAIDFGRAVGRLILEKIKSEHSKGNFILPPSTNTNNLRILVTPDKITYTPRDIHFNNTNIPTLGELIQNMQSMAFMKPPVPFAKEKEYRFLYTIISGDTIIPPIQKHIIIDSDQLQKFII